MIERHLQKRQYERVKIPEQKIFQQLSSFERIRHRHPRLLQRTRARWDEPITIRRAEALQNIVQTERFMASASDEILDIYMRSMKDQS